MAGGRPPKFRSAKQHQQKIDQYFDACDAKNEHYTITGLTMGLGFISRTSLMDYMDRNQGKEKFANIIKRAKLRIENAYEKNMTDPKPTESIFVLKNFGWRDVQEHQVSGPEGGPVMLTNLERAAKLRFLIEVAMRRLKEKEAIEAEKKAKELPNKGEK